MWVVYAAAGHACFAPGSVRQVCHVMLQHLLWRRFSGSQSSIQRRNFIYTGIRDRIVSTRGIKIYLFSWLFGSFVVLLGSFILINRLSPTISRLPGGPGPIRDTLVPRWGQRVRCTSCAYRVNYAISAYWTFACQSTARSLHITVVRTIRALPT